MEKDICPLYYALMSGFFHTLPTPVRKGYTFEGWYTSANGGSKVTEKTVCNSTKNVTVYARWAEIYVTKIAIESYPSTTSYYIGDNISISGGTVKATYNDGSTKNVAASDCKVSYPDMSSEGTKNVRLAYGNKETTYMISVKTPQISVSGGSNGNRYATLSASYEAGNQQNISIKWNSSDTSVATVDGSGNVAFNKNRNSNGSTTITASFDYMGHTYSAGKSISISYGSWSGYSESAVGENDNRQVRTDNRTENTTSYKSSLSGWTQTGSTKEYTGETKEENLDDPNLNNKDGNGFTYKFKNKWYRFYHIHNWYDGRNQVDSIPYGDGIHVKNSDNGTHIECSFASYNTYDNYARSGMDKGGKIGYYGDGLSGFDGNCYWVIHNLSRANRLWFRQDKYCYILQYYKIKYSYSRKYTVYSSRSVNYSY